MELPQNPLRVRAGGRVRPERVDPSDTSSFRGSKRKGVAESKRLIVRLDHLQELLYACHRQSLLIVLQGLDTSGKDGTIRHVFEGVNPQGVRVARFRVPTETEADHDFLWRIHPHAPSRGEIVIFNRSHYEDVLAARVERTVPTRRWKERYRAINEFERELVEEGTIVLKFFLHVGEPEQLRRIRKRLEDPTKHWKFSLADLGDRPRWSEYMAAIGEMITRTNTEWAPWYLVPSDHKWFRNWAVSKILVETLESFRLSWPPLPPGVEEQVLRRAREGKEIGRRPVGA